MDRSPLGSKFKKHSASKRCLWSILRAIPLLIAYRRGERFHRWPRQDESQAPQAPDGSSQDVDWDIRCIHEHGISGSYIAPDVSHLGGPQLMNISQQPHSHSTTSHHNLHFENESFHWACFPLVVSQCNHVPTVVSARHQHPRTTFLSRSLPADSTTPRQHLHVHSQTLFIFPCSDKQKANNS
jgi:hypothetical protein